MIKPVPSTPAFIEALTAATISDVEFSEEPVRSHADTLTVRQGYKATAVRGVPVPNPALVVLVHAVEPSDSCWCLLDWTHVADAGAPQPVVYSSELEAKEALLKSLKAAFGRQL